MSWSTSFARQGRRNVQTEESSIIVSNNSPSLATPTIVQVDGRSLLVPGATFSQRVIMGNESSSSCMPNDNNQQQQQQQQQHRQEDGRPLSNLSVLMMQQERNQQQLPAPPTSRNPEDTTTPTTKPQHETDLPSFSSFQPQQMPLSYTMIQQSQRGALVVHPLGSSAPLIPHSAGGKSVVAPPTSLHLTRHGSFGYIQGDKTRRCLSSKELVTLAPPSGSPYAAMLHQKEEIESKTRQRLLELLASRTAVSADKEGTSHSGGDPYTDESTTTSTTNNHNSSTVIHNNNNNNKTQREGANQSRNRRRSQHYHEVVNDLCDVVADLFVAESKLIKPLQYGVQEESVSRRTQVVKTIQEFIAALPSRYALGADTPSEVLLHMRLMAAARAEKTKAVIHIHSLQEKDSLHSHLQRQQHHGASSTTTTTTTGGWSVERQKALRLVTICCSDADGLLELITKNLSSGGSRVMDADVMLSSDGIALDRFVVQMTGRLRLDKLAQRIESFLKHAQAEKERSSNSSSISSSLELVGGSIYFNETKSPNLDQNIQEDLRTAVPLLELLDSSRHRQQHASLDLLPTLPNLRKTHSMPPQLAQRYTPVDRLEYMEVPPPPPPPPPPLPAPASLPMKREASAGVPIQMSPEMERHPEMAVDNEPDPAPQTNNSSEIVDAGAGSNRQRRPLVNRSATYDLDGAGYTPRSDARKSRDVDYVTVPAAHGSLAENRRVPLIPFEELMLIETIGTGRVSTIYRAVWQRPELSHVRMVALKVAMVNSATGDTAHVDELRREADIAARLSHPNICALTGVAADAECFCLAYDFAEGGSLHSLLSDSSRYYEYLPIALDVANGMAYLHSRNIIHRDLKPSNILLTRDHRAKICDFGMSIMNMGQELTAETGTYRYMAPEVIRHENYSSNADVYSFGICLWQLITREVPFANMTPIQAAYAVAEGRRPTIPPTTPRRLQEIIMACWDQDSYRRPSFTYVAMALADYAKMAFSPANVGALTLQIANEMLATVKGNSTVNVDFSTPVNSTPPRTTYLMNDMNRSDSMNSDVGLEI